MSDNVGLAFLVCTAAGLSTTLGAATVFNNARASRLSEGACGRRWACRVSAARRPRRERRPAPKHCCTPTYPFHP